MVARSVMKTIDKFLNNITMYKLVLYGLTILTILSFGLSLAGVLSYSFLALVTSLVVILFFSGFSNFFVAKLFKATTNIESVFITAFILFLVFAPSFSAKGLLILAMASLTATLSKYLLAIGKRHIFNPVAITAVIFGIIFPGSVVWWVGTPILSIVTLFLGLLIVKKIRRFPMVLFFVATSVAFMTFSFIIPNNLNFLNYLKEILLLWPFVFFAFIMFTEPLTTPPTKQKQIIYAIIVGVLFSARFKFGFLFSSPEIALVVGNIYSYLVSSKQRLILHLKERVKLSENIYGFIFSANQKLKFQAGQYLEWTLPMEKFIIKPDSRGNRRYFTVALSPTELSTKGAVSDKFSKNEIQIGVRIDQQASSSFKKNLLALPVGAEITASHLAGEFTMPKNISEKLVFVAGGIGITPFRSMIKYLIDTGEKRDVVLFYSANSENDFAYTEIFQEAKAKINLQSIYLPSAPSESWQGPSGRLNADLLAECVPDFLQRLFYLSGPNAMVENYKKLLLSIGVKKKRIKTDYFPGF